MPLSGARREARGLTDAVEVASARRYGSEHALELPVRLGRTERERHLLEIRCRRWRWGALQSRNHERFLEHPQHVVAARAEPGTETQLQDAAGTRRNPGGTRHGE